MFSGCSVGVRRVCGECVVSGCVVSEYLNKTVSCKQPELVSQSVQPGTRQSVSTTGNSSVSQSVKLVSQLVEF